MDDELKKENEGQIGTENTTLEQITPGTETADAVQDGSEADQDNREAARNKPAKEQKTEKDSSDKPKKKKKKLNYKICLVAVLAGLVIGFVTYYGGVKIGDKVYFKWVSTLDYWMTDKMFQPDDNVQLPITIIAIDEESIAKMGSFTEWKRDVYGRLIEALCTDEYEPAVIGFDILFTSGKDPETDKYFADVAEKYGSVVAGMYLDIDDSVDDEHNVENGTIRNISYPYDELNEVVTCGFTNNEVSEDGIFRILLTQADYKGQRLDPFSLAIYKIYAEKNGISVREFDENERSFLFTFSTKSGRRSGFQVYSLSDVLEGSNSYAEQTNGGIVLVGAYAAGFQDDFFTAADRRTKMYGVQIHANEIEAFYQDKLQTPGDYLAVSIIFGLLLACLIITVYLTPLPAAISIAVGAIALEVLASFILHKGGTYLKVFYFVGPAALALIIAIIMHYLSARKAKNQINNAFKMYVAPEIVDEMASDGKFELKLGGQTKDIAVLFIDIRGFTTMSEKLPPEEVVSILNEYFGLVTDAIFRNKGTIDKFVGDAAMAVFNSPNDLDDYTYRAVHTGWDILLGTQDLLTKLEETHHRTIGFGIGVNCGPATVGNIGSSFRMDFTAIGDTVNTSARLEANAKAGQILISQDVLDRVSEWVEVEKVEGIKLKGKSNEFNIYNITKVIDKPGYLESGISVRKAK